MHAITEKHIGAQASAGSVRSTKSKYRPEIDGLRAFAVISVIINHFNKELLPSGYLGVDIFFVISGYVITSSLTDRKDESFGAFIAGFYERRIKRLAPALIMFVMVASVFICLFNPEPQPSIRTGISSLFGVSNIQLFSRAIDYFAQSTELNPFTHTWSLGVEEQFYVVFPLLFWFSGFGRQEVNGARNIFLWIGLLALGSLAAFVYLYQANQPAAYFLMPTRFWEMAAGCIIFVGFQTRPIIEKILEKVPPLLVIAAMLGVMLLPIDVAIQATISIVLLTLILIACLKRGTAVFRVFTHKRVVYLGLLSYSLYLWHWGVLSISRWTIGIHWWTVPLQISCMLLFAASSYRWIESSARKGKWFETKSVTIATGVTAIIAAALFCYALSRMLGGRIYLGKKTGTIGSGMSKSFTGGKINITECFDFSDISKAFDHCIERSKPYLKYPRTLWVMGDSHAFTNLSGLRRTVKLIHADLRLVARSGTAFPPPLNYVKLRMMKKAEDKVSFLFMKHARDRLIASVMPGDVVIILVRYPYHFGPDTGTQQTVFTYQLESGKAVDGSKSKYFQGWLSEVDRLSMLLKLKNASLVVMGPVPEWKDVFTRCDEQWFHFSMLPSGCTASKGSMAHFYQGSLEPLRGLARRRTNLFIFDTLSAICPSGICKVKEDIGEYLYTDDNHLSDYGSSKFIAPALAQFIEKRQPS